MCPLLPSHLLSLSSSNKDFITQLSRCLSSAMREQKEEDRQEEKSSESREVQSLVEGTEVGSPRYFNQMCPGTEFQIPTQFEVS